MVFSFPWWIAALGLAGGYIAACGWDPVRASEFWISGGLLVTLGAVGAALWAAWARWGRFPWGRVMVLGVGVCAMTRGWAAGQHAADPWLLPSAGVEAGWQDYQVVWASTPGARCQLNVREWESGREVTLVAPASVCPLAQGQHVRVRVPWRAAPALPGDRAWGGADRLHVDGVWLVGGEPAWYWNAVARFRQRAWELSRGDEARAFLAASLLGLRSALSPKTRSELRTAGLGHLIAVSGMHVGLAALLFHHLAVGGLMRLGAPLSLGVIGSCVPVVAYIGLTGAAAPAVRAGLMYALLSTGIALGRPGSGVHALTVAATLMLACDPSWALDPGFQLSLMAMGAIVRSPPGESLVAQTWRVTWAILPLCIVHFEQANAYGVLANVLAVPGFTLWVAPCGALGWTLVPWLGAAALEPAAWGVAVILLVAKTVAQWPPLPLRSLAWGCGAAFLLMSAPMAWWRPRLCRILPSRPILLTTVLAVAWVSHSASALPPGDWWAVGDARQVTLIGRDAHGRGCVTEPVRRGIRWPSLLSALGVRTLARVEARRDGPHITAFIEDFERLGRWTASPIRCPDPPQRLVRALLLDCMRRQGGAPVAVAASSDPAMFWCYERSGWAPIPLSFP